VLRYCGTSPGRTILLECVGPQVPIVLVVLSAAKGVVAMRVGSAEVPPVRVRSEVAVCAMASPSG